MNRARRPGSHRRTQGHGGRGGVLLAALALILFGLAGCASRPPAADCTAHPPVPWQAVAPGIWVWPAAQNGDVSAANAGHVMPTSVVVSDGEALVVDPGPSHAHGLRLRASLACHFGARVRWVVNTHAHAENVMANSAFTDLPGLVGQGIVASEATRRAMEQRCPACLASLRSQVSDAAMADTRIVLPSHTVSEGDTLAVGRLRLEVRGSGPGHTEGDLVLWHAPQRVLWAGGLVYDGRLPELAQGSLDAWLASLERLQALEPQQVLGTVWSRAPQPGTTPPALDATRGYLQALRSRVLLAMEQGHQPTDTAWGALPAYQAWAGYGARHGFNLQRAWRELEPVWMEQGAPPAR